MKRRIDFKGAAHRKKYLRAWYRKNKARIAAMNREPVRADHNREADKVWRAANPDRVREMARMARARIASESPAQRARRLEKNNASYRARRIRKGLPVRPLKTCA